MNPTAIHRLIGGPMDGLDVAISDRAVRVRFMRPFPSLVEGEVSHPQIVAEEYERRMRIDGTWVFVYTGLRS